MASAAPLAFFPFPDTSFPTSAAMEALHRPPLYTTKRCYETVKTLSMTMRTASRIRLGRAGGAGDATGYINVREHRRSSMIMLRPFSSNAPSRRVRSVLWGGSIGGESDEEMNDRDGNDGKEQDEQELAEDVSIDLRITLGGVSGSNGEQKTSFGQTYSLTDSEGEIKTESFLPSVRRNARDITTPYDAVENGGMSPSSIFRERLPRFFPTSSDEDQRNDEQEEEGGMMVKKLIELPFDGILLQLIPALLIVVLGLFLTVAVQVEAGRFDAMVGENSGKAVMVTDLRDLGNAPP